MARYPYYECWTDEWNNDDRSIENPDGSMLETRLLSRAKKWCRDTCDASGYENAQATVMLIESRHDSHFVFSTEKQCEVGQESANDAMAEERAEG